MKPQQKVDEKTLKKVIDRMPADLQKVVNEACKKHGLLPGGGSDKEPKNKK